MAKGAITKEETETTFKKRAAIVLVYNNSKIFLEILKKANDFHTPNQKDIHAIVWKIKF
jgi:hypothetical protein